MRFEIRDVGHGAFAYLVADDRTLLVFDCAQDTENGFSPGDFLCSMGHRTIARLFVSNFDEDHISGLPRLRELLGISTLHSNLSVSADWLKAIKEETPPVSFAMNSLLQMKRDWPVTPAEPQGPDVQYYLFWNTYPTDFEDTNNLSMVTFLRANSLRIVLPGDLEAAGWRKLLQNPQFGACLKEAKVFVASHHGREDGYCPDVFDYCRPDYIVISDGPKEYATQEMVATYGQHASGIILNGVERKVLTTRTDKSLFWDPIR